MKRIEELRWEIILAGESPVAVTVGQDIMPGSKVERRATRLADSTLLLEMERITKAIEDTYARTKEEARRVIWVKYGLAINWQPPAELIAYMQDRSRFGMPVWEMAEILAMDESTFHRYRTGFVYGVAERLGWY